MQTHQNSLFFRKKNETIVNQIELDKNIDLFIGDSFGLLVDEHWFLIKPSDDSTNGSNVNEVNGDLIMSNGTKRKIKTEPGEPDSTNKKVRTEQNEFEENDDLNTTINVKNEMPSTSTSSNQSEVNEQNTNEASIANQPIKLEPLDSNEVEPTAFKTESDDENIDSTNESGLVPIKTEVKEESADNDNNEASASNDVTSTPLTSPQRTCCRYGIRCYRYFPSALICFL